ncbi:hypothetical protein [Chlorobium sp.]|uniref:hypothetical protein n=1 Tax=Chlorobium sp. TaxID=1095 RepID=UPI002F4027D5
MTLRILLKYTKWWGKGQVMLLKKRFAALVRGFQSRQRFPRIPACVAGAGGLRNNSALRTRNSELKKTCRALAVIVFFHFAKRVILPKSPHNPCIFRMDKKTLSGWDVEDNKQFLGEGMQQALKAEPMACLLIDKRGKV